LPIIQAHCAGSGHTAPGRGRTPIDEANMKDRGTPARAGSTPAYSPAIGLREVLEAAPDMVFCCDTQGRFAWASTSLEGYTGKRASALVGQPFTLLLPEEERARAVRTFMRQLRRGRPLCSGDFTIQRADGSRAEIRAHVRLYTRPDGEQYFVGVAREGRDRQPVVVAPGAEGEVIAALEARVRQLETELEDARETGRVKGEVLATMSHEIRQPMNGVMGMAAILGQTTLTADQRRLVEVIRSSSEALVTLVSDALDHARLEAGRLEIESIPFDLRVMVEQVMQLMSPSATGRGLTFESRVDPMVPSRLKGDPGRVRQVLINLLGNAVKFTEKGSVTLRVERDDENDSHVSVLFRIVDTGIGMTPEQQARIFEAFTQADNTIVRRFGGSGLGLSISRRLVNLMGGMVGAESTHGEGSTFWFRVRFEKQPPATSSSAPSDVRLRGLRVLVADSLHGDRHAHAEMLAAWGCEVEESEHGMEALERIRQGAAMGRPFAIALVDMGLEGLSGEALGAAVRGDSDLDSTVLMLTTRMGRPGDAMRARDLGFSAYLHEPVDASQLFDAIAEVVANAHSNLKPVDRPLVTRHSLAEAKRGRFRILLVEDDAVNQLVTQSALNRVGFNVEIAQDGHAAIQRVEAERWDVILMDLQMPGLDGIRATAAIRARERGSWRTPILGLTGDGDRESSRERCLAAGMDDVFAKPVDLEVLTAAVERWTTRADARGTEAPPPASTEPPPRLTVVSGQFEPPAPPPAPVEISAEDAELPEIPEGPSIDLQQLNLSSMSLPALRASLLQTYLGDVFTRLQRLEAAVESGDAQRTEFEAHGLKGMCATIGASRCAIVFGEMERRAREGKVGATRPLLPLALQEVRRSEEYIARLDRIVGSDAA
jgi:PAS domain S-box-containing protein